MSQGMLMRIDVRSYQRVLGEELRKVRQRRRWTRSELHRKLQTPISLQTLATYEQGTRQLTVVRLAEICLALGEPPHDVLARVHARQVGTTPNRVTVDLRAVVAVAEPGLAPLRRWAQARLHQRDNGTHTVHFDLAAVGLLAQLCGVAPTELIERLRNLSTD